MSREPFRLLVLGGTRFLGRHLAQQALDAGHRVTLLHRSPSALLPEAEHRLGDRNRDLASLLGGDEVWDAVIDTSAYVPRQVRDAARVLHGRIGHYQLVSTISVYRDVGVHGVDEDAPLAVLPDPATETVDGATYGGLKALCERALLDVLPADVACIVRPGLLVGPFDPTQRFGRWLERVQRGGTVLCPGAPQDPVQFIDARDAAAFMLQAAERRADGVMNLSGPVTPLTMGAWLEAARAALNPTAELQWVDASFLLGEGVEPWSDLPLWLAPEGVGLYRTDLRRAIAAGLACRPLEQTVADTASWLATQPETTPSPGLTAEREAQLLERWRLQPR